MLAGRRMLQADSAHNISATFAYDTTPTVAASFPGTFTADRYTYELQQQGESETVYLRPAGAAARLLTFLAGTETDSTQLSHADIRQHRAQYQRQTGSRSCVSALLSASHMTPVQLQSSMPCCPAVTTASCMLHLQVMQ